MRPMHPMHRSLDARRDPASDQESERRAESKLGVQVLPSDKKRRPTLSASLSKPLLSTGTGLVQMSKLGPSQQSLRSQRRNSPFLLQSIQKQQQADLAKKSRERLTTLGSPSSSKVMHFEILKKKGHRQSRQAKEEGSLDSRNGISPGVKEVQDEIIRKQLLVGKLRAECRYEGMRQNTMSAHNVFRIRKVRQVDAESNIPLVLSEQASELAYTEDEAVARHKKPGDEESDDAKDQNMIIIKKSRISPLREFKPHDLNFIEENSYLREHEVALPKRILGMDYDEILSNLPALPQGPPIGELPDPEADRQKAQYLEFFEKQVNQLRTKELTPVVKLTCFHDVVLKPTQSEVERVTFRRAAEHHRKLDALILLICSNYHSAKKLEKTKFKQSRLEPATGGYYIYLEQNPENLKDPYDLVPIVKEPKKEKSLVYDADAQRGDRLTAAKENQDLPVSILPKKGAKAVFFTLSANCLTLFVDNVPVETVPLKKWLRERDLYYSISGLTFFKKFRKWKTLKNWAKTIKRSKREQVEMSLRERLFHIDPIFGPILLEHKAGCQELEQLRVIDLRQPQQESFTIAEFRRRQVDIRSVVEARIKQASEKNKERLLKGINIELECLKEAFRKEEEDQIKKQTVALGQESKKQTDDDEDEKENKADPVYEQLGFGSVALSYGQRMKLREACRKFLRFSFLIDFIALQSLSCIYLRSIEDCTRKLKLQTEKALSFDLILTVQDDGLTAQRAPEEETADQKEAKFPLFMAECRCRTSAEIPKTSFYLEDTPQFLLPPIGDSKKEDFNPMVHLELEEEIVVKNDEKKESKNEDDFSSHSDSAEDEEKPKKGEEEDAKYYRPPTEEEMMKKMEIKIFQAKKIRDLHTIWLTTYPEKQDISFLFIDCFKQGFDSLKHFQKWSMNKDLAIYDAVLEPWDYRSYEQWGGPDHLQEFLNCDEWLEDRQEYIELEATIEVLVNKAQTLVDEQLLRFEPALLQFWINSQIQFQLTVDERLKNQNEVLPLILERFTEQKTFYEKYIPGEKDLGLIRMKFQGMKDILIQSPRRCMVKMKQMLPRMLKKRLSVISSWMSKYQRELTSKPENVDEFVKQIQSLEYVEDNFQDMKQKLQLCDQIFTILDKFDLLTREDKQIISMGEAYQMVNSLTNAMYDSKDKTANNKDTMKKLTNKKIPQLNNRVTKFEEDLADPEFIELTEISNALLETKLMKIKEVEAEFAQIYGEKLRVQEYMKTLDMGRVEPFINVEEQKVCLHYRSRLWKSLKEWEDLTTIWMLKPFSMIDIPSIQEKCQEMTKTVLQCERNLPVSSAVSIFKKKVWNFNNTLPIVEALGNENLEQIHWQKIKGVIQDCNFSLEDRSFCLGDLIRLEVGKFQEEIVNISVSATQEFNIRRQLEQLNLTWQKVDYDVVNHKNRDSFKVVGYDVIAQHLDESMSILSVLIGSQYAKRSFQEIQDFQTRLMLILEVQELMKDVQRTWLYLESVFSSADIRKQRPRDFQEFEIVNRAWNKLMRHLNTHRNVRKNANPLRVEDFKKWNKIMDKISRGLETYLEEKRLMFPRFYFISNEELLKILAHASDLREIEKHMNKCFENIQKFTLADDEPQTNEAGEPVEIQKQDLTDIFAVRSQEGEEVRFGRVLKVRAQGVEYWLSSLEEYVSNQLQRRIKEAYNHYYGTEQEETERTDWVMQHLGQCISVVGQITWTESTEVAINDITEEDNPFAVEDHLLILKQQLNELTELIRSDLSAIRRRILVALITQEVHQRDIVANLFDSHVQSCFDFLWQQQLKYYLEDDLVVLRQVNCTINYSYEYLGPTSRLIITPLTDQCWLTITGALHIKLGAAPSGPAGTGKTESTKDLAKALGIFCVVINCSEQVDYQMMAKLFSGVVQTGAWSCLDEFNRINPEVLSVIAQQLLDIRQAKVMGKAKFEFNGIERDLKPQCGVYVTMNPGYKGRVELPDNLKVLFRPVSMMIPNYAMIAEIMLFAEGFQEATQLSTKMVQLYKLSSEQLSQQDHYDFGLRAVKSVLVMAGNMKRKFPNQDESMVLIRAMRDANIPKFLSNDLPLFEALIQDLFPGVQIPEDRNLDLEKSIDESMTLMRLQSSEEIKSKALQLFNTLNVRFGVMLVGGTGGGKTTTYKVLAQAQCLLGERPVKFKVLNPKSISMGELYGEVDLESQEWSEGLASKIMRKFALAQTPNLWKWTIFDGPVDAIWIENMNTVLDDNMTLCLSNGERIKLNSSMRILFEVQDLAVASPATVSRCGMVYLHPDGLGWRPIYTSWLENYVRSNELLTETQMAFLHELFDTFVDLLIAKMGRADGMEQLETTLVQKIRCVCNLMEYFLNHDRIPPTEKKMKWARKLYAFFAFSLVWGFCSAYTPKGHRYLDSIFRDFFPKLNLGKLDTIFQFYYDPKEIKFKHLQETVPKFNFSMEASYFSLFVPTLDSVCYSRLIEKLVRTKKHAFITGATGVGKSILVSEFLRKNHDHLNLAAIELSLSAQTTSSELQSIIESKLEKKRGKKVIGALGSKSAVIVVDDVNMPLVEEYGAQPPIELLRQLIDNGVIYDRPKFYKKRIQDYRLICVAAPPGGGRAKLTPRFMRHFHIMNIPNASREVLTQIFETIVNQFLSRSGFTSEVQKCGNIVVSATIELYMQVNSKLLPIPSKFHYLFNQRDISKVFQGVLMTRPFKVQDTSTFFKLWLHECQRIFMDRLINEADREYLRDLATEIMNQKFKVNWKPEDLFQNGPNHPKVLFTTLFTADLPEKSYEPVNDWAKLVNLLQLKMSEYNISFASQQMSLILFEDAVDHICRVARILSQPRGNAMLIGVTGCGKQSLTRLTSFMLDASSFSIKLSKSYRPQNFRDDLKVRLLASGCSARHNVLILNDTQLTYTQFLEDVNNLLNTGEIVNLYEKEDFERMKTQLQRAMKDLGRPQSQELIYQTYIERVRDYFHIILCMSPVGDQLRIRCRDFPSLVNCCTLDWFDTWPQQALETVAYKFITQSQIIDAKPLRHALSKMFPAVHSHILEAAATFFNEKKRHVYITPKTFIDALELFKAKLNEQHHNTAAKYDRLQNGIQKLEATNAQIEELQVKLTELVPKLQEENLLAQEQAEQLSFKRTEAVKREEEAKLEAEVVTKEAEEIRELKEKSDAELEKAKPALQSALRAVNELNKDDINELKKVNNPVAAVDLALKCTLLYLGYTKPDWSMAQKALADMKFLDKLKNFEKDHVSKKILDKVRNLTSKPEFKIEVMTRASKAAGGLAKWCVAIRKYVEAQIIVRPLLEQQAEMTAKFEHAQIEMKKKLDEVREINRQIIELQDSFHQTKIYIQDLADEKALSEQRLSNASDLTSLLSEEGKRWREEVIQIRDEMQLEVGNIFLCVCMISYLGPFTGEIRDSMLAKWVKLCKAKKIKLSDDFSISRVLSSQGEIRQWAISGLPSDKVSIQNAIFTCQEQKWPLLIDPQLQGLNWLKKKHSEDEDFFHFKVPESSDSEHLEQIQLEIINSLENCLAFGKPALVQDIGESIDPLIDQIVTKQVFVEDGERRINWGARAVTFNDNFRFFLTTKLANPHYMPEVFIKTLIVNFTVTFDGLEEQLLADVVANLEPEVEQQRDRLVQEIQKIQNEQYFLQSSILTELAESNEDTILDNVELIASLQKSKSKSEEISKSLLKSEQVQVTIAEKRNQYRPISLRGSVLYFVIASLAQIDPMYQYSLDYVKKIFNETTHEVLASIAQREEELRREGRELVKSISDLNTILIDRITEVVYINVCQGLFEAHKICFSFIMTTAVQRNQGVISDEGYDTFIRGPGLFDSSSLLKYAHQKEVHDYVSEYQWEMAQGYSVRLPQYFENFLRSLMVQKQRWMKYLDGDNLLENIPTPFSQLPMFYKLLIVKMFKPHTLPTSMREYVHSQLGSLFSVSPKSSLELFFSLSKKTTPMIFILSQGADPNEQIIQFARKAGMQDRLFLKSLGQGQEAIATALIKKGMKEGDWVFLQNCHLFKSWMPTLETLCDQIEESADDVHPDFRLILTSMPVEFFPASILQNGLKMTTELPSGIRANLVRTFSDVIDEQTYYDADTFAVELEKERKLIEERHRYHDNLDLSGMHGQSSLGITHHSSWIEQDKSSPNYRPTLQPDFERQFHLQDCWKSLLFGLAFFHSIIQERRKYGSLGWNIRYEFNDSDLDSSLKMLKNFIFEAERIPWDSMRFMTGFINYGGRVTDENDRTLLMSILSHCYGPQVLDPSFHKQPAREGPFAFSFFGSGLYTIPRNHQDFSEVLDYIYGLPVQDPPEIFGMHENAELAFQQLQTRQMIGILMEIQTFTVTPQQEANGVEETTKEPGSADVHAAEKQEAQQKQAKVLSASQKQDLEVMEVAEKLLGMKPAIIDESTQHKTISKCTAQGLLHCYSTVLFQEIERYNRLLARVDESLQQLMRAIQGLEIMSPILDQMYSCFLRNQVPPNWNEVAYSSLKSLATWFLDLQERIKFITKWLVSGHPQAYWLPGFFFPHGFLTGVLQTYARTHQKAIDFLKFKFIVYPEGSTDARGQVIPESPSSLEQGPEDGVYMYGMFVEAGQWEPSQNFLIEQSPGRMTYQMPMIHFLPFEILHKVLPSKSGDDTEGGDTERATVQKSKKLTFSKNKELKQQQLEELKQQELLQTKFAGVEDEDATDPHMLNCPLYKTAERVGVLSTTGQSTNFVLSVNLLILPESIHQVLRLERKRRKELEAKNSLRTRFLKRGDQKSQEIAKMVAKFPKEYWPEHWTLRGTAIVLEPSE